MSRLEIGIFEKSQNIIWVIRLLYIVIMNIDLQFNLFKVYIYSDCFIVLWIVGLMNNKSSLMILNRFCQLARASFLESKNGFNVVVLYIWALYIWLNCWFCAHRISDVILVQMNISKCVNIFSDYARILKAIGKWTWLRRWLKCLFCVIIPCVMVQKWLSPIICLWRVTCRNLSIVFFGYKIYFFYLCSHIIYN